MGKPLVEIIGEEGYREIAPHVERVLRGETVNYERTIQDASGGTRVLEVVAISDIEPASDTAHADRASAPRKIAITCRDLSTPDGRLVTFEGPAEMTPGAAKSARAL